MTNRVHIDLLPTIPLLLKTFIVTQARPLRTQLSSKMSKLIEELFNVLTLSIVNYYWSLVDKGP